MTSRPSLIPRQPTKWAMVRRKKKLLEILSEDRTGIRIKKEYQLEEEEYSRAVASLNETTQGLQRFLSYEKIPPDMLDDFIATSTIIGLGLIIKERAEHQDQLEETIVAREAQIADLEERRTTTTAGCEHSTAQRNKQSSNITSTTTRNVGPEQTQLLTDSSRSSGRLLQLAEAYSEQTITSTFNEKEVETPEVHSSMSASSPKLGPTEKIANGTLAVEEARSRNEEHHDTAGLSTRTRSRNLRSNFTMDTRLKRSADVETTPAAKRNKLNIARNRDKAVGNEKPVEDEIHESALEQTVEYLQPHVHLERIRPTLPWNSSQLQSPED
ncbi:hypothetical protein EJ08DRAFT_701327 [Tothia fuscella]|uniref:Uncharacterized protein n=1 Tax=Tothia fuscella TaxID=1048955 RepID=A0A9P4NIS6_9PEZI|nr:hypothetical protein EJ08DRAFT_701327 [Tothia fuscella]